jgi:PBP1b-binding outer membrane lipoprotein LpoB
MDVPRMRIRRCGVLAAALILLTCIATPSRADSLDQITVQAQRETLRKQVDQFFHSAMLKPGFDESPLRWEGAVCPMVVGMMRAAESFC